MNSSVILLAAGVFIFGLLSYLMFMIFLPEWVGITGKKAREAQQAHKETRTTGPDLLGRMQDDLVDKPKNKAEDKP